MSNTSLKDRGNVFDAVCLSCVPKFLKQLARIVNVIRANHLSVSWLAGCSSRIHAVAIRKGRKTLLGHKFARADTITLKYYGNEKLSPTRAMFASFSAKDNATTGRIYGTLFCKWTFLVGERYREFKAG